MEVNAIVDVRLDRRFRDTVSSQQKRSSNLTDISSMNSLSEQHLVEKSFFQIYFPLCVFSLLPHKARSRFGHSLYSINNGTVGSSYQIYTNCNIIVDIANNPSLKSLASVDETFSLSLFQCAKPERGKRLTHFLPLFY